MIHAKVDNRKATIAAVYSSFSAWNASIFSWMRCLRWIDDPNGLVALLAGKKGENLDSLPWFANCLKTLQAVCQWQVTKTTAGFVGFGSVATGGVVGVENAVGRVRVHTKAPK